MSRYETPIALPLSVAVVYGCVLGLGLYLEHNYRSYSSPCIINAGYTGFCYGAFFTVVTTWMVIIAT